MSTIVVIDDDAQTRALLEAALEEPGVSVLTAADPIRGLELVEQHRPPVVLLDLMLPKRSGLETLSDIMAFDPEIDVLIITAYFSAETAVRAIQQGAADYLEKPLDVRKLRARVAGLLEQAAQKRHAQEVERELARTVSFEGIIGRSPLMLDAMTKIRRVATHYQTLLLTGATGTGKELFARAVHHLSPVAEHPFVVCNCAALPSELVESELFGHVKGAFTGAHADRIGLFEAAHGGTLFLDEIGELSPASQAKLLRAVQQREIQRLGSSSTRKVKVRIVAATNRDLRALSETKEFREDLYFRLSMVEIQLPRLAERREDLPLLVRYFVDKFAQLYEKPIDGLTQRAEVVLSRYAWPGNVRELENALGYAAMLTESRLIDVEHLPQTIRNPPAVKGQLDLVSLDEIQRLHAQRVLEYFGGDKVRTAELLGVSRATLYRLLDTREKLERVAATGA